MYLLQPCCSVIGVLMEFSDSSPSDRAHPVLRPVPPHGQSRVQHSHRRHPERRKVLSHQRAPGEKPTSHRFFSHESVQGDTSGCGEPPVDIVIKVPFMPGLNGADVLMSTGGLPRPDVSPCILLRGIRVSGSIFSWALKQFAIPFLAK